MCLTLTMILLLLLHARSHSLFPFTLVLAHTLSWCWFPRIYQLAIPGLFSVMK